MKDQDPEDFYKSLVDNTLDGLVYCRMVFDAQQRPVDYVYKIVNKNFETLTGLHNVIGKTVTEVIPGVHISNPEFFEIYGRVALTGKPERFETYVQPLGRWFSIATYCPQKGYFVATFQNITAQKQTEMKLENAKIAAQNVLEDLETEKEHSQELVRELRKFQQAVTSASEHIIITDPDGIILFANPAAERITGFSQQEIIGKRASAKELWDGMMGEEFYSGLWKTIKVEKKSFSAEIKNHRKNGQEYYAQTTISPILGQKGNVEFFIGIERDITKEKEIDRAKSEFVSLASHQLRTPPTAMNWYLEMLLNKEAGPLTAKQQTYLKEVYENNQRMIVLINALLNVSRMEMGTLDVEPERMNFAKCIAEVVKELQPQRRRKRLHISQIIRDDIALFFDPKLLQIIAENLITNAIKYTPSGGSVTIASDIKHSGEQLGGQTMHDDVVVLTVTDTGYGIPKAQQERIFTKLFRADNVKTKDTNGTGLGLYLVKLIVSYCHGNVWFHSEENKGTTFFLALPVAGIQKRQGTTQLIAPHG